MFVAAISDTNRSGWLYERTGSPRSVPIIATYRPSGEIAGWLSVPAMAARFNGSPPEAFTT